MKQVEHSIHIAAPAGDVVAVVSDVTRWPVHFPPTVHAESIKAEVADGDGTHEIIRIWAMANGALRTWTSRRVLSADGMRIDFRQIVSQHPVAAMGGTWIVEPDDAGCLVRLLHTYAAVDDDAASLALIDRAVDTNSRSELAALKASAEAVARDLLVTFEDTVVIGASVEAAYEFIRQADLWPERIPHVARLELQDDDGLQIMTMDTRSPDGSVHTTTSGRVCFAGDRIVYKQSVLPAGLAAHLGCWTFRPVDGGTAITSQHTVLLDPDGFAKLPSPPPDLDHARAAVRRALGTNSTVTMTSAGTFLDRPTVSA